MADNQSAEVIQFAQAPKKRAMTSAERGRAFRKRKREEKEAERARERPANVPDFPAENVPNAVDAVRERSPEHSWSFASVLLMVAATGLGLVGITINAWFARSLGSTDTAGWLFLAIGVGADLAAMALPSRATRLWQARQHGPALAGWALWAITFVFALTAGIGFASTNIADVTLARSSRGTPAVAAAQSALADAMAARDRECKGGVGRFCREREATVADRRQAVDQAMHAVQATADPQSDAAMHMVAWISDGLLRPTGDDFAMVRLLLLALLPQIGGILLMIGRAR